MASGRLALPRQGGGSAERKAAVSDQTIADAVDKLADAPVGTVEHLAGAPPPALADLAAAAEQGGGSTGKKRKAEEASPPRAAAAADATTAERQTTGGRSRRSTAGKKPLRAEFDDGADSWDDDSEEDSPPKGEAGWVQADGRSRQLGRLRAVGWAGRVLRWRTVPSRLPLSPC